MREGNNEKREKGENEEGGKQINEKKSNKEGRGELKK
jgi:hypothetical protein